MMRKKLTNEQRCKQCFHKSVCKWYRSYDGLDEFVVYRCKHYISKKSAYKEK